MNTWGVSVAVAAVLTLSACGGSSDSGTSETRTASVKPSPKQIDSAAAIGKLIGCRTPLKVDTASMAQEERYCKVGRSLVSIVRAPDRATLEAYAATAGSFGANVALVNDHWGVSSMSRPTVTRLAKRNGWELL
jgi:hypothetical protein